MAKILLKTIVPEYDNSASGDLTPEQISVLTDLGKHNKTLNFFRSEIHLDPIIIVTAEPINLILSNGRYPCTLIYLNVNRQIYIDMPFKDYLDLIQKHENVAKIKRGKEIQIVE